MKADLDTIKKNLRHTTQATEEIKAQIAGALWLEQKRWDRKWECYVEMVKNLGEVHTLISEAMTLRSGSPDDERQLEAKRRGLDEAFQKYRQFGVVARIFVSPNVRTVLTRFGDEWSRAGPDPVRWGIVARWGRRVIEDIARNDLFGEPREMSDEFTGDVQDG